MARRSTKLLRFENSLYSYKPTTNKWEVDPVNLINSKQVLDLFDKGTYATCKHMSQKVNPLSFRMNITNTWHSLFYKTYKEYALHPGNFHIDHILRTYLITIFNNLSIYIDKIEIKSNNNIGYIDISLYEPGLIYKKDVLIKQKRLKMFNSFLPKDEKLTLNPYFESNEKLTKKKWFINTSLLIKHLEQSLHIYTKKVFKISLSFKSDLSSSSNLVSQYLAREIENSNANFKVALKKTFREFKRKGNIKGIRINCSGRLGRAPMARTEWFYFGQIPMSKISSSINYGTSTALTKYGSIGVKVWIYHHD